MNSFLYVFALLFFRVNLHFKKSFNEYRKLSFQDSHKKNLEFMREYDEDYRVETDLTVFAAETYMETTLQPDTVIHRGRAWVWDL